MYCIIEERRGRLTKRGLCAGLVGMAVEPFLQCLSSIPMFVIIMIDAYWAGGCSAFMHALYQFKKCLS